MTDLQTFEMNLQWEAAVWKQKKEACEPPWVACHTDECVQLSFSFMPKTTAPKCEETKECAYGRNHTNI